MIVMVISSILAGCGAPAPVEVVDRGPLPADSVYALDVALEDDSGETVALGQHRGHPTLISMFYANCPMACPTLIGDVRALEDSLPEAVREDLRVLLVSLDPERDTPALMRGVISDHDIDADRWSLTRPPPERLREIAAVLGVRYRPLSDGEMSHSSIVTLLDRDGRKLQTIEGLNQDASLIVNQVLAL